MGNAITGIRVVDGVSIINISNLPGEIRVVAQILRDVADRNINVDVINQTTFEKNNKVTFSFTIADSDVHEAIKTMAPFKKEIDNFVVEVDSGNTKICVEGQKMPEMTGVAAAVFEVLAEAGVEAKLTSTSETDISIIVADRFADDAAAGLKALI